MKGFLSGIAAALYVVACFLPGEPSGGERVEFQLDFAVPYRVPVAGTAEPTIRITAGGQTLGNPHYRLESLDQGIVRVDPAGRGLEGVGRGPASVRVIYQTATAAVDTVFTVQVVVSRIAVGPPVNNLTRLEATSQLSATAYDAREATVPNVAFTWSSADPGVATVNDAGLVRAVDEGTVAISAEADDVKGLASITVTQVAAQVRLAPELDTLRTVGRSVQFIALAFDSSSNLLRTARPHWTSIDAMVATVDGAGLATATGAGTARIIARVGSAADTATLVVVQVIRFLVVTPGFDTLTAIADTGRFVALAFDSSGIFPIPNPSVGWTTSDAAVATVDQAGLVRAERNGVVLVTASAAGQSAFATVLVRQEVVAARIAPDNVVLMGQGATAQLSATGLDRNGYPVAGVSFGWRSGSGCIATVDTAGRITALGAGTTAIIASPANGGQSDTAVVTVAGAPSLCSQGLIAFSTGRDIYVMNADGSGATKLTTTGLNSSPVWSPDGSKIAFTRIGWVCGRPCFPLPPTWILVMNADGSGVRQLTNTGQENSPVWSPDGTRIAFRSFRDGNWEIYVMNADGSGQVNLTNNAGYDDGPVWSPDGTRIAFWSDLEIYVMNADGSGLHNLTNNSGSNYSPAWSPDGARIAFIRNRDPDSGPYVEIYVMNADGSGVRQLTNTDQDWSPVWSPDGTRIAFRSQRDGNSEIYVMHADGSGQINLTNNPGDDYDPVWSPDGARIAFNGVRDDNWEIYVMNADGSGLQNLTNNPGMDFGPAWRPR